MSTNLVIGKFLPLHKGHEFLLKTAAMFGPLDVVIGVRSDDMYDFNQRRKWIKSILGDHTVVHYVNDDSPTPTYDENGTALDEWFWEFWVTRIKELVTLPISNVFSSDLYGGELASRLDATWIPVDPARELIPTSGSSIRENIFENWHYLPDCVKRELSFKVAIVGPESTGKTSLTNHLASRIVGSKSVQEYGRTMSENRKNNLSVDDFKAIYKIQDFMIQEATKVSPIVITDTEELTTYLFSRKYLEKDVVHPLFGNQDINLYILLEPTVPLVDDGERVLKNDEERWEFFNDLEQLLKNTHKNYVIIGSQKFVDRQNEAYWVIKNELDNRQIAAAFNR